MKRVLLATIVVVLAVQGCGGGTDDEQRPSPATRELMGRIFQGIRVALPESVGAEPFSDPTRRGEVAAALALLAEQADLLERHAVDDDAETRFLARSFARDAHDLRRAHAAGRNDRAAFLIRQITEGCIGCHARLPDRVERPLAEGFVESGALATLPVEDRVALQMATRRFDDALATLEARLAGPEHPALMIGPLTDHLVLSIRVKNDYERPVAVLRRFAARDDLWTALRRDVEHWTAALPELSERAEGDPDLDVAREIVAEGRGLKTFPGSHRALAHYVVASSILERWLERHADGDAETAEALYLRGLVEAWIGRNYWITSAPYLLETAIRTAPGEPFALDAYALLERELLLAYEGADEELPLEDAERLGELRSLIEAASN